MTPPVRRIVTGHDAAGRAIVARDDVVATTPVPTGDARFAMLWTSAQSPADLMDPDDAAQRAVGLALPGGSVLRMVDIAPGCRSPMHRTRSLDYGIVLTGEIVLELDDGATVTVHAGEVIVQRGTIHYFPTNYVWSLSVAIALESGGKIGEVDEICRPLLEVAKQGDDAGTTAFFDAWCAMADKLIELADEDLAGGRVLSAGTKRLRASLYYLTAERMQRHANLARHAVYARARSAFEQRLTQAGHATTWVEIPYGPAHIAGLFVPAHAEGPAPCLIHVNGLDSTKELFYFDGLAQGPGPGPARRGLADRRPARYRRGAAAARHARHRAVRTLGHAGAGASADPA